MSLNVLIGIMASSDIVCHDFIKMGALDHVFDRCLPGQNAAEPREEEQMTAASLLTAMCEHDSVRKHLLQTPDFVQKVLTTANKLNGQPLFATMNILYKFMPETKFQTTFVNLKGPEYLYRGSKNQEASFFFQQMIAWWCCANPKYLRDNKLNLKLGDKLTISEALYHNACNYEATGGKENAVECLQQLLILQPSHSDTFCKLGILLHQLGRVNEGAEALEESLKINPAQVQAALTVARRMLAKDRSDENLEAAANLLQQGVEEVKKPPAQGSIPPPAGVVQSAYKLLTDIYLKRNNLDEVIETAHDWILYSPNFAKAHEIMGQALTLSGEYQDALESLFTASVLNSSSSATCYYQAQCHSALKQPAEAVKALDRALKNEEEYRSASKSKKLEKHVPALYMFAGTTYNSNNQPAKAISAYETLVKLTPSLPTAHFYLGKCALKQGDINKAYASFTTAMKLLHQNGTLKVQETQALKYIGNVCKSQKEGQGLKEMCQHYVLLTQKK